MDENIISVRQLTKQYQTEQASGIRNISFDIKRGDIIAVIGESGSGKSTLLKSIFGLLKVDEGEVLFNGKRVLGPHMNSLFPDTRKCKL
ncbi:ATP-binding cassette domain-containing protein [Pedobacter sp. NJ-S-72]